MAEKVLKISIFCLLLSFAQIGLGQHSSEPIYQDPFDIGAGGASLTRASRNGRIFSNPALLPYGGDKVRWVGTARRVMISKDWIDYVQEQQGGGAGSEEGSDETAEIINDVMEKPLHIGQQGSAFSYIGVNFGFSTFETFEADIEINEFGETGLPEMQFRAQAYTGNAIAMAARMPGVRWLSGGVTVKYLGLNELDIRLPLTDIAEIESTLEEYSTKFQDAGAETLNMGVGYDLGLLTFFQGKYTDFTMAAKVDDFGGTALTGKNDDDGNPLFSPSEIKQTTHAGVGATIHGTKSAVHFSLDVRDIEQAYGEEEFKRIRAGMKITLLNLIGVSTGVSHGYPSYGAEIDFLLFRLTGSYYTKEMGDHPNVNPRRIVMITASFGSDF